MKSLASVFQVEAWLQSLSTNSVQIKALRSQQNVHNVFSQQIFVLSLGKPTLIRVSSRTLESSWTLKRVSDLGVPKQLHVYPVCPLEQVPFRQFHAMDVTEQEQVQYYLKKKISMIGLQLSTANPEMSYNHSHHTNAFYCHMPQRRFTNLHSSLCSRKYCPHLHFPH